MLRTVPGAWVSGHGAMRGPAGRPAVIGGSSRRGAVFATTLLLASCAVRPAEPLVDVGLVYRDGATPDSSPLEGDAGVLDASCDPDVDVIPDGTDLGRVHRGRFFSIIKVRSVGCSALSILSVTLEPIDAGFSISTSSTVEEPLEHGEATDIGMLLEAQALGAFRGSARIQTNVGRVLNVPDVPGLYSFDMVGTVVE